MFRSVFCVCLSMFERERERCRERHKDRYRDSMFGYAFILLLAIYRGRFRRFQDSVSV